jgi:hypothetical protein
MLLGCERLNTGARFFIESYTVISSLYDIKQYPQISFGGWGKTLPSNISKKKMQLYWTINENNRFGGKKKQNLSSM